MKGYTRTNRTHRWILLAMLPVFVGMGVSCAGPVPDTDSTAGFPDGSPVYDRAGNSLGSVAFGTTCSPAANEEMRRGLGLLHHMTHVEAESAFRRASEADDQCALAYWGMAISPVHPLWPDVPSDEAFERGSELLERAREVGTPDPREEAYIAALEAYYRDGLQRSESQRLVSYADGWAEVARAYPNDPEAALFRALSLLATASNAEKTYATRIQAGEIAEQVLAAIPDHPGAHHYVIHAYDVPRLADRALAAARNYGAVAPDNAHALHMTSHIFTRAGLWQESIEFNERSAAAALRHPVNGRISHHYLHALDYLAYAHLQTGNVDASIDVMTRLTNMEGPVVDNAVSAYTLAAVPARIALERGDWEAAAAVPVRVPEAITWDAYPHLEAIAQFARAMGAARAGDYEAAELAAARLGELREEAAALPESYDWATLVEIQEMGARAWIEYGRGSAERAVELMVGAADLESTTEKHPVTPGEVLPAWELLGDMLIDLGRHDEALAAYQVALERSPKRLNSLYGAARAAELAGDLPTARQYYGEVVGVSGAGASDERLAHARLMVTGQ